MKITYKMVKPMIKAIIVAGGPVCRHVQFHYAMPHHTQTQHMYCFSLLQILLNNVINLFDCCVL